MTDNGAKSVDILVVDDEKEIADLIEVILSGEKFSVRKFYDAREALSAIQADGGSFQLAILDVMMPGIDGFTLCRKIREKENFPIIMLTARGEDADKITGLALGADDYITKPFNPLELTARVRAQLRRYQTYNLPVGGESYAAGGLVINRSTHECTVMGEPVELTPKEFDIVWLLCENGGNVVSSEEIFERVWGERYLDSNNTVMVHIRRIREKFKEPPRSPRFIKTVWGVGYKIEKNGNR